jgi:hypothetical protein
MGERVGYPISRQRGLAIPHGAVVEEYYQEVLNRHAPPATIEVLSWVDTALDLGAMRIIFESLDEFFANG